MGKTQKLFSKNTFTAKYEGTGTKGSLKTLYSLLPPVRYAPPVTEQVSLHSKSLCKNTARASGGANNMHPQSWGHKRKRSKNNSTLFVKNKGTGKKQNTTH